MSCCHFILCARSSKGMTREREGGRTRLNINVYKEECQAPSLDGRRNTGMISFEKGFCVDFVLAIGIFELRRTALKEKEGQDYL